MSDFWTPAKPTTHMKELCKELGADYRIICLDFEHVIYRDFGNGYDLEISGVNTTSSKKKATLYLWQDSNRVIKTVKEVSQHDIGMWADWLCKMTGELTSDDFGPDGFLLGPSIVNGNLAD